MVGHCGRGDFTFYTALGEVVKKLVVVEGPLDNACLVGLRTTTSACRWDGHVSFTCKVIQLHVETRHSIVMFDSPQSVLDNAEHGLDIGAFAIS